jgi:hypothetical protein
MAVLLAGCVHTWRRTETTGTITDYAFVTNRDVPRQTRKFTDTDRGGAVTLLADPSVVAIQVSHTNQEALGGGSLFSAGPLNWKTSTNAGQVVDAVGGAAGTIIGDAAKAVAK